MRIKLVAATATLCAALVLPSTALAGHGLKALDHEAPAFTASPLALPLAQSGGPNADWEYLASFTTGNPHTDLDFFTQQGETYVSLGTLGTGANGAGQTIFQLTSRGEVKPRYVSNQPSAQCTSNPVETLGLQHDVEATPKGGAILNASQPNAVRSDTQLLVDATDAPGRCHDQGNAGGFAGAPQGGLELVDVTDIGNPVEIGLTSHIGEAHTVNIDPKRPHIAYAVTSDAVTVQQPANKRENEIAGDNDALDLDGFEVVDMSSCMYFPRGTTVQERRNACRPQVFRYRYPSAAVALGHTEKRTIYGCHELEIYADDRLTCGRGAAAIVFNMSRVFDDNGTPTNFRDDHPRGHHGPMPCRVRDSSSLAPFRTGAKVTDCVDGTGEGTQDLDIPSWLAAGKPGELLGVRYVGTVHHMGRGAGGTITTYDSTQDVDFDHELEYSASRRYLIATDERGGGVAPPGATCPTSPADNPQGNGGVHFYRSDRLFRTGPPAAEQAWNSYARTPDGGKAIYRAPVRTQPQASTCTAHVFQQIPGQNRIFMGWYSQGTQVVDFRENADGTIELQEAGYFIPANANQWVSHVFKWQRNANGTYTYWGVSGDFALGAGRNSVEVWKVTMPAPPAPRL
jgi:hypothetical protein